MLNPPELGQAPKVGSHRELFLHFETKAMRPLSTVHRQAVRVLNPPELGQTPKVGSTQDLTGFILLDIPFTLIRQQNLKVELNDAFCNAI